MERSDSTAMNLPELRSQTVRLQQQQQQEEKREAIASRAKTVLSTKGSRPCLQQSTNRCPCTSARRWESPKAWAAQRSIWPFLEPWTCSTIWTLQLCAMNPSPQRTSRSGDQGHHLSRWASVLLAALKQNALPQSMPWADFWPGCFGCICNWDQALCIALRIWSGSSIHPKRCIWEPHITGIILKLLPSLRWCFELVDKDNSIVYYSGLLYIIVLFHDMLWYFGCVVLPWASAGSPAKLRCRVQLCI